MLLYLHHMVHTRCHNLPTHNVHNLNWCFQKVCLSAWDLRFVTWICLQISEVCSIHCQICVLYPSYQATLKQILWVPGLKWSLLYWVPLLLAYKAVTETQKIILQSSRWVTKRFQHHSPYTQFKGGVSSITSKRQWMSHTKQTSASHGSVFNLLAMELFF